MKVVWTFFLVKVAQNSANHVPLFFWVQVACALFLCGSRNEEKA